jgi:hypothetical protein
VQGRALLGIPGVNVEELFPLVFDEEGKGDWLVSLSSYMNWIDELWIRGQIGISPIIVNQKAQNLHIPIERCEMKGCKLLLTQGLLVDPVPERLVRPHLMPFNLSHWRCKEG